MRRRQSSKIENTMNNRGFSLIEVLIGLAIFSIGILAVASMQITATSGNAKARFATEASTLARDQLERLLSLQYDPAAADFDTGVAWGGRAYRDPTGFYTIDWRAYQNRFPWNDAAYDFPNNSVGIIVRVEWKRFGARRRYELSFIKTEAI
jgi:prepilin-type N-terminal cleavage/methylation domain-containing protein